MGMSKGLFLALFLAFAGLTGSAQTESDRYMVFFKDKVGTPFNVSQKNLFLSPRAINRREKNNNIAVLEDDLPVSPTYVSGIANAGAKVIFKTKWMNGVLVEATPDQVQSIGNLPFVLRTEYVARGNTGSTGRAGAGSKFRSASVSQASQNQNAMLALDEMHKDGITGDGIIIAILDTGFPGVTTNPAFNSIVSGGRILDSHNFGIASPNAFTGNAHGAQVFSIIAATLPDYSGGAYGAKYLLYATEFVQTEYRVEEYNWLFAAERADSAGADIISTSLGYTDFDDPTMDYTAADLDGNTSIITKAAAMAYEKGMVVISSAGNYGNKTWRYISPPADARNVIAVGSVDSNYQHSIFSSYGPTADGRIKPDVMAMGTGTANVVPGGTISAGNGTSFACPLITSLAAGIMQNWPELTNAEVIDILRQSGSMASNPDNSYGYGIPTYRVIRNMLDFPAMGNSNIVVYPNPVTEDRLQVAIAGTDASITRVRIYSVLGQQVSETNYQVNRETNPLYMDVSALSPGLYFVRVENKDTRTTFRIIKR
jgi:hypothetical protein